MGSQQGLSIPVPGLFMCLILLNVINKWYYGFTDNHFQVKISYYCQFLRKYMSTFHYKMEEWEKSTASIKMNTCATSQQSIHPNLTVFNLKPFKA
jgi:hypothetical protein